jgi:AraC family transcriptional regulator
MSELQVCSLLETDTVAVRNIRCTGSCRHLSPEECAAATHLVFPYRGVYVRHVGNDQAVADANHVLFFNSGEGYRVSHPLGGGDECLSLALSAAILHELAPASLLNDHGRLGFRIQHQRIDPRAQALVAVLRHSMQNGSIEPLEAENLLLTLVCRSLGARTSHPPGATPAKRRLVNRVKLLLASNLTRRWTLAEIAVQIGGSPVYLTQVFQQVEGMPLYRYQLRLRLARALDLISQYDDLSALAIDLGFSSHSHFAAVFKQTYGRSPSAFKQSTLYT